MAALIVLHYTDGIGCTISSGMSLIWTTEIRCFELNHLKVELCPKSERQTSNSDGGQGGHPEMVDPHWPSS